MTAIATIGHSTHPLDHFLSLLVAHGITAIADVRSSPYSRHTPHYNREPLRDALKAAGIGYVFLGAHLGARSDDPRHYEDGRVVYARLARSEGFREAIDRLIAGAQTHDIALMCAEKDPLTCHRTILVARALAARDVEMRHILPDGGIETQDEALDRLMRMLGIDPHDLFAPPDELRDRAYRAQEEKIAYVRPDPPVVAG